MNPIARICNPCPQSIFNRLKKTVSINIGTGTKRIPVLQSVRACCAKSPDFVPVAKFRSHLFSFFLWITGVGKSMETSRSDQYIL